MRHEISGLTGAIGGFLSDPVGALDGMRATTPPVRIAAMALVGTTLLMTIVDYTYGPLAFPHTPQGKRQFGALFGAMRDVITVFAMAGAGLLLGRWFARSRATAAEAIWLMVAYALALLLFELVQMGTWVFALATGIDTYGPFFFIGFSATLLVLVVVVRVLHRLDDWLTALLIAGGAFLVAYFVGPIVSGLIYLSLGGPLP
ncbi:MAG: hypothetical protein WBA02_09505 [Jannaschia helgolandensis]|uniref:Uncharacterized protein n=1 Tax=Jannaschia helgolandensis TaxID=188906 RepID=A0A1H7L1H6_9RHOB|nr:hypothetical protein [Jannaschia helgolandensis]SEK92838.1 hypothetical protein SAMN04488526_1577 [Jannaschia helgolandensis]